MGLDFLVPVFGILVVLVPIIGLTTVFTLRLGGKPFVETLARELRGLNAPDGPRLQSQVEELTEQVETLTAEVRQLRSAQSFDEKLLASRDPARSD